MTTTAAPDASAPVALALAGAALVLWLLAVLVRYVRADHGTRASMRQAARIRWTWRRLARMQGLSVTDKTPTLLASLTAKQGQTPKPRELTPKITTRTDRHGVIVTLSTLPRIGLDEVQKAAPHLANAWRCARVSVAPLTPGTLRIRAVRSDPLTVPTTLRPDGLPPEDLGSWGLGLDEYAEAVSLRMANIPGITVAGLPGYGKTSLINGLVCRIAPSAAVQFAVADGKVSTADEGDYADMVNRFFAFVGDDLADANALFKRMVALRRERSSSIRRALGVANMWHVGPSVGWPLVVLVVDEAHTYFREYKGNDAETKRLAALSAENARLVEDLVKKGRSVGMVVVLATQKATGDAIPTFIRDVCPVGLSFAQKTAEAAVAALGEDIRNWPDANPINLQNPAYVGVASMVTQGRPGFTRVRMPYVDPADAAQVARDTAHLTADPAALLARMIPAPRLSKEDSGAPAS